MRSISVPCFDSAERYVGDVTLTLDIDERRNAERALLAADRRKDEYLAMLAHELRNPLAPIRTAVTNISRLGHAEPQTAWAARVIERQTETLAKLLDDLLDVGFSFAQVVILHLIKLSCQDLQLSGKCPLCVVVPLDDPLLRRRN
jgi:two-component system CheB/CheR fusion protein